MKEFDNQLIIKDEPYKNGFHPIIPNFTKQGSAYILTDGANDSIVVDAYTTTKEIRQGKYKRLVEVSTIPYTKEINFNSSSKETSFSFQVYVKAVIQVKDPIVFYNNRNIDVDAYFNNLFSLDVRKITRKYSILDYDGMDEELTAKLSTYNNFDESTGFEYRISVVDAQPGDEAREYVQKHDTQRLDMQLKRNARELAENTAKTFKEAVMTEVVEGKLSETEAILKIEEYDRAGYQEKITQIDDLRERGFITDVKAQSMVKSLMLANRGAEPAQIEGEAQDAQDSQDTIDAFYTEE